jgi:hypothetical protein
VSPWTICAGAQSPEELAVDTLDEVVGALRASAIAGLLDRRADTVHPAAQV